VGCLWCLPSHRTDEHGVGPDPSVARYKAFLFVGLAYFLTAVLAPLFLLMLKGAPGVDIRRRNDLVAHRARSEHWARLECCWRLARGANGRGDVDCLCRSAGGERHLLALFASTRGWAFQSSIPIFLGIALAALGGFLVTYFKPGPSAPKATPPLRPRLPVRRSVSKWGKLFPTG